MRMSTQCVRTRRKSEKILTQHEQQQQQQQQQLQQEVQWQQVASVAKIFMSENSLEISNKIRHIVRYY